MCYRHGIIYTLNVYNSCYTLVSPYLVLMNTGYPPTAMPRHLLIQSVCYIGSRRNLQRPVSVPKKPKPSIILAEPSTQKVPSPVQSVTTTKPFPTEWFACTTPPRVRVSITLNASQRTDAAALVRFADTTILDLWMRINACFRCMRRHVHERWLAAAWR